MALSPPMAADGPFDVDASGIVEFRMLFLPAGGNELNCCLVCRPAYLAFASIIYFLISRANIVCLLSVYELTGAPYSSRSGAISDPEMAKFMFVGLITI